MDIMRFVAPEIEIYFASLCSRIGEAVDVPFVRVSRGYWEPAQSYCHKNVDSWVEGNANLRAVRGWLTGGDDNGTYTFIAHSVVEDRGNLFDITPLAPGSPSMKFLIDHGSKEAFDAMQPAWHLVTYPFATELSNESAEIEDWLA
jgi:hypothetical protein